MVPDACFHTSNPIVIGVDVVEGVLKPGTPLVVPDRDVSITQTSFSFKSLILTPLLPLEPQTGHSSVDRGQQENGAVRQGRQWQRCRQDRQ